jgi:hypothetical protein
MSSDADLEIGLSWDREREAIYSYLRFDRPGMHEDDWEQPEGPVAIDLKRLRELERNPDPMEYGTQLADMLLGRDDIGRFYERARKWTEENEGSLHVRLHINAPARYHAVRWETLRDPYTERWIATQPDIRFSRYLSSSDSRPIPPRPKHQLKGILLVAAPTNVDEYAPQGRGLAKVDLPGELERARSALADIDQVVELTEQQAGLAPLLQAVNKGVDVLYLVCHGALSDGVPQLYLEKSDRAVDVVDGRLLAERFSELDRRPTVVALCSCQSSTRGDELWTADDGELSALGPRLARAGVAAVVAMQGNISMASAQSFFPKFFGELQEHGEVARASAAARRELVERPDWWSPVLFSRLRSGRTYYEPEFTKDAEGTWRAVGDAMEVGRLTALLGPGLADRLLGSRQEMAMSWAQRWQMPLAAQARGDLAQVAQYLRVRHTDGTVRAQMLKHLASRIAERSSIAKEGDPFWGIEVDSQNVGSAIMEIGRRRRETDPNDPFRIAAAMPVSAYITTGWTSLLQDALVAAGREPVEMRFGWRDETDPDPPAKVHTPTVERPLVYHLFGHLDDVDSLVLTEDDYFAWSAAWLQKSLNVPKVVKKQLVSTSLLFLGFRLDDWDFRVVFHAIKSLPGSLLLPRNQHVGVQVSPQSPHIEPDAVQDYLESYFGEDKVHIYWGESAAFLKKLREQTGLDA